MHKNKSSKPSPIQGDKKILKKNKLKKEVEKDLQNYWDEGVDGPFIDKDGRAFLLSVPERGGPGRAEKLEFIDWSDSDDS